MVTARIFVLLWFLLAFALSITGWFERFSSATLFGIGAGVSASGFAILHWLSSGFRGFARVRGLKRLTRVQVLRLFGILALVKAHQQVLPAIFAIPTGVIDIVFAVTSFFVAARLVSAKGGAQPGFFLWHVLGLQGLAVSVTLAVLTSSTRFGLVEAGITSQPMAWFPMSLVPTFIGPLMLICHLLALVSAPGAAVSSPALEIGAQRLPGPDNHSPSRSWPLREILVPAYIECAPYFITANFTAAGLA